MSVPNDASNSVKQQDCQRMLQDFVQQQGDKGVKLLSVLREYIRYCHAKMYILSTEDQQEVLQEVVLKLFQTSKQPDGNCTGWLFTIVRNEYIDHMRKQSRQGQVFVPDVDGHLQPTSELAAWDEGDKPLANPHNLFVEQECLESVFDYIESQPTGTADIQLYTQYAQGYSHAEIATQTGRTAGAIAKRLSLLRERVRQLREALC